jgi:predicted dehydrogenase
MKIGVLGAGHLGKVHIKVLQEISGWEIVGFYDPDDDNALQAIEKFGIKRYTDIDKLIADVDALDIVTPTVTHFALAKKVIKAGKHFFVEKPLVSNLDEAKKLLHLEHEANLKIQVGHVERFNPAFLSIKIES